LTSGEVTFGCLNGFGKVSDAALSTWVRILLALPRSRLLLHANPGSHRDRTHRFLERFGVDPSRCEFVGLSNLADYFRLYHRIDVALDPFPYAGGTTTCDALWMGVPVVTLRGPLAVGRGGVSILKTLGIEEWIAGTEAEYVSIATRLATNLPALAGWRSRLRSRMIESPLMNAGRCARDLESAYREMWKTWCAEPQ
jgi:predicted O-linked N-acetylglucosamine transferase (SPINDLY family)